MTTPRPCRGIFSILFICFSTFYAAAQSTVSGTVKNAEGKPVEGASVSLFELNRGTLTDVSGYWQIDNISKGSYKVIASIVGATPVKKSINISDAEKLVIDFVIEQSDLILKEVTITSTGIKDEIKDIAGTVNVIDGQQIRESGAQSVGQIINRIPGVNYLDEDGRGLKPNIGLRGLDPLRNRNLLVLVDGKFPIGMTLYGDPAAYYMIPLQQVERVEVIKGASPVLYGGYSVGGVVNMITKKGEQIPETKVDIGYGSWNGLNAQISSGADHGKWNYYISGLRRQGDGYRDRSAFEVDDYSVRLGSKIDESSEISIYLNYFAEDSETPGGLTQEQYDADPRQSQHGSDHFYAQRFSTALSYRKSLNEVSSISTSLYGNYFKRDWWIAYSNPTNNGFLRDIHAFGNVTDYNLTQRIFGHGNSLIVGARFHTDRLDDINVAGANAEARTGPTTGNRINTSLILETYIYDEFDITENLTFAPGVRYTSVKYRRNDLMLSRQDEMTAGEFVYSGGVIYKIQEHSRVYSTFSKGFQPPALNSALAPGTVDAGVDLASETSKNLEVGFRTNPLPWLSLNVSAYRMNFDNKIVSVSGVNRNVGESLHRGVEAEVELGAWSGLSMFANASIQKATLIADNELDGNILPNAPQRLAAAGVRYRLPIENHRIVFNFSHNYVGKQYSDLANTEAGTADGKNGAVPSYHASNFTANYTYKKWGIYTNINNLFDAKYFTLRWATWNGIIPAPGRNLTIGMNYKF